MHTEPKYTAAEVLEAGRRAEAEGRAEYAVQFYRHVAASFAGSPEASIAAASLSRMSQARPPRADRTARHPPSGRITAPSRKMFLPGRLISGLIEVGGWTALALAAARVFAPAELARWTPEPVRDALALPVTLLVTGGVAAILTGELLRAVFAGANAAREMAALARDNVSRHR